MVSGYSELLSHSKELILLLNGLVSSISGIIAGTATTSTILGEGLQKLSALNTMSEEVDSFWASLKQFRVLMLIRTILQWRDVVTDTQASWIVSTELLRLIRSLVPSIKHLNGDFWEKAFDLLRSSLDVG